jgi:adenosine deaminase
VELHRHLEGSIRLQTLVELGAQYAIPLPAYEAEALRPFVQVTPADPPTFDNFLSKFAVLRQFFCAPEVISRVVREAIEDAAADHIRYLELRFTPNALAKARSFPFEEVLTWVCETVKAAEAAHPIRVNLIVSMNRHESLEIAKQTLEVALKFMAQGVVGIDLAGKEPGFPARPFSHLFREAKRAGLGVTIHAGEWEGADNVRDSLESLRTDRVGHGVRIVEDSSAVQMARQRGVFFEVCPTSNLQTGTAGLVGHHPVLDLRYLGMPITINTDDPTVSQTTLTDEYALAVQGMGLTLADIQQCILSAARAAFLPEAEKQKLIDELRSELGRPYRGMSS